MIFGSLIASSLSFNSIQGEVQNSFSFEALPSSTSFAGGNGSESNPYRISNITQLQSMNEDLDAHYILVNDINASETRTWNDGKGFLPIGNLTNSFDGSLDGKGFDISGLEINRSDDDYIGLISISSQESRIKDLTLSKVMIMGNNYTGGLIGTGTGNIFNCSIKGEIRGVMNTGGIFGAFKGIAERCNTLACVRGSYNIGGLVGYLIFGLVKNSSSHGVVDAKADAGGLVGKSDGKVENCFATGNVYGEYSSGGLIGSTGNSGGSVKDSYSTGNVNSSMGTAGGLVGYIERGKISNCYSIGKVSAQHYAGGLIGSHRPGLGSVVNSYWDKETSGRNTSDLGTGMNTSNMMKQSRYAGWDFENTWNIMEDSSYPFLRWCDYGGLCKIVSRIENDTAYEDYYYRMNLDANTSLPGGKGAFWNIITNAGSWLTVEGSGVLSGTPTNNDVGEYEVNASATINNIDFDYLNFTLEVVNTNDPPMIETTSMPHATEDLFYSFIFEGSDIDPVNDKLTWSIVTDAGFLDIDPETGTISGTPTNNDTGSCTINIFLDDGNGGIDEKEFRINVYNTNDDPVILPFDIPIINEDESFSLDLNAFDEDPTRDNMLWSMRTDAGFIEIGKRSGMISGLPGYDDIGSWWVHVYLSDEKGGSDDVNFTLTVLNVNDDPIIQLFDVPDAVEDIPFYLDLDAEDIDPEDVLEWNLETNASFLSIDRSTGNIKGSPTNDDVGTWSITVSVFDGNGGSDYRMFELEVLNVNDAPIADPSSLNITMDEGTTILLFHLDEVFHDDDGDTLRYAHSLNRGDPMAILTMDGRVTLEMLGNWSGIKNIIYTASDGFLKAQLNITVNVRPVNDPLFDVTILANPTYREGEDQTVNSSAKDVDLPYGDELTYKWSSNITGEIGSGKSINLSLPPGKYQITLIVTDKEGLSASKSMEIEVLPNDERRAEGEDEAENGFLIPFLIISIVIIFVIAIVSGIFLFLKVQKKKEIKKKEADLSRFQRGPPLPYQYIKGDSTFMIQRSKSMYELNGREDHLERLNPHNERNEVMK